MRLGAVTNEQGRNNVNNLNEHPGLSEQITERCWRIGFDHDYASDSDGFEMDL
jgi:hypothetical protein